jgi:hypothetical protein
MVPSVSMTVAFALMAAGAADMARAILSSADSPATAALARRIDREATVASWPGVLTFMVFSSSHFLVSTGL